MTVADRLRVPRCAGCGRPVWTPVAVLCVTWAARRWHVRCCQAELALRELTQDEARWTPAALGDGE
jgi:hypothetical protein